MKKEVQQQLDELTRGIASEFENELISRLPFIKYEYINSDNLFIRIPALNKDFGDIKVNIWYREITVYLGYGFHTHFEVDTNLKNILDNNAKQVIYEVIEFIEDILNDRIFLRVKMLGNRIISSCIAYEDNINEPVETMGNLLGIIRNFFSLRPKEDMKVFLYSWSESQREVNIAKQDIDKQE